MTPHDRYRAYLFNRTSGVPMCETCKYYCQHYGYAQGQGYYKIADGHCTEPRVKCRMPFDMCERYEAKEE